MPGYIIKAAMSYTKISHCTTCSGHSAPFELAVIPTGSFHETLNFPPALLLGYRTTRTLTRAISNIFQIMPPSVKLSLFPYSVIERSSVEITDESVGMNP